MDHLAPIAAIADRQHGLVTQPQARDAGWTRHAWRSACAAGAIIDVEYGVGRLVGAPVSSEQAILRTLLSVGAPATASHASAAYLWGGLDRLPDGVVDVIVLRSQRSHRLRSGARVHRPVDWIDVGEAVVRGIRVAQPLRTLVDLGATAPHLVGLAVDRMIIKGVVTRAGLERGLRPHSRQGRAGIVALRAVLAEWTFGDVPPASVLETTFSRLVAHHRLPTPTYHYAVNGYEIDAAWPDRRVGAEVDGWDKYTARHQFQKQVERDAVLASLGWQLVHFTWQDVTRRPAYVAAILRKLVR